MCGRALVWGGLSGQAPRHSAGCALPPAPPRLQCSSNPGHAPKASFGCNQPRPAHGWEQASQSVMIASTLLPVNVRRVATDGHVDFEVVCEPPARSSLPPCADSYKCTRRGVGCEPLRCGPSLPGVAQGCTRGTRCTSATHARGAVSLSCPAHLSLPRVGTTRVCCRARGRSWPTRCASSGLAVSHRIKPRPRPRPPGYSCVSPRLLSSLPRVIRCNAPMVAKPHEKPQACSSTRMERACSTALTIFKVTAP